MGNHAKLTKVLLRAGADPNLPGPPFKPPLYVAASRGAFAAAKVLARGGANLEELYNGKTALLAAARANNTGMVRMLVKAGADIDALDGDGMNALHWAAQNGNIELLRLLRAAGSWLHTPDALGQTVLHCAVIGGSALAVEEVLKWGAIDVNAGTNMRATPLHLAAITGFLKIAELLIAAGADVNAVGGRVEPGAGATALEVAMMGCKPEVIRLLLKAGAEVDPSGGVLIEAAQRGCQGAVDVLLQARNWPDEVKAAAMKLVRVRAEL
jgi:ankyrin repeat protein